MERIICAAIWYDDGIHRPQLPINIITGIVIGGWRHFNCLSSLSNLLYPNWQEDTLENLIRIDALNKQTQGFLTSRGRFVNRVEAGKIAIAAQQIEELSYSDTDLFSEDLY